VLTGQIDAWAGDPGRRRTGPVSEAETVAPQRIPRT
jgi:hypothetical protein